MFGWDETKEKIAKIKWKEDEKKKAHDDGKSNSEQAKTNVFPLKTH